MKTTIKLSVIFCLAAMLIASCNSIQPPINDYMNQEHIVMNTYASLGITPEMESRLSDAFKEQVDWESGDYDGRSAQMALAAIKAELEWIKRQVQLNGYMNYYSASESYERLQYWTGMLFGILDKISENGDVDKDTSLIYFFVRKSINTNLSILSVVLDKSKANISTKANSFTINQFKEIAENMLPLLSGIL